MTITLSPETQKLLENRMKLKGLSNPDDALRAALMVMEETEEIDDRSLEMLAAIKHGLAQARAGQTRHWEEVEQELIARRVQRSK